MHKNTRKWRSRHICLPGAQICELWHLLV